MNIDRIERQYDPENDMGEVTWVDMELVNAIRDQQKEIELLKKQIELLDHSIAALEEVVR